MATSVVIVESPAKADTINKYLGKDFKVLASYGHIRDLPAKNGSVDPDNDFAMLWELSGKGKKQVDAIAKAAQGAERVILATDPDREGEAISWHVYQTLKEKKALKNVQYERVVFNEITKKAVKEAMANPRQIHQPLVDAYLARRALDYLVGFTLSPVLWRKLPGSRSAGRVQSVALRLICEREAEIEVFQPQEYWSIDSLLHTAKKEAVNAHLVRWQGDKMGRLSIGNEAQARAIESTLKATDPYTVIEREEKTVRRNPSPPFITSTLQQEAARKLGFSVTRTMQTAQKLYEGISFQGETIGLITYMRTDGTNLAQEAVDSIRKLIGSQYGNPYVPPSARVYKTKAKNAQEAHEAIRPTDIFRTPSQLKAVLNEDQFRLYELIWKRTVACQMEQVVLNQLTIDIANSDKSAVLRTTGSTIAFDGFYRVYREGKDDASEGDAGNELGDDDSSRLIPPLEKGQQLTLKEVVAEQHFTKPPPRFTEASLVKQLEELGIGRPSTYASIIRILQERNYVRMENRRFTPEDRGRLVTTFLVHYFPRYVEYDYTAGLEEKLDDITANKRDCISFLKEFWGPFLQAVQGTKDLTITQVLDTLDAELAHHFFGQHHEDPEKARQCPQCKEGRLSLKLGRFGAFIGCSRYPDCKYTKQLTTSGDDENSTPPSELAESLPGAETLEDGSLKLGTHPEVNKSVLLCRGPYGYYVQLGSDEELAADLPTEPQLTKTGKPKKVTKPKPKRASLPPEVKPAQVTFALALQLLSLPRELGQHPDTGDSVSVGIGRFGPFTKVGDTFVSLKKEDDPYTVTLDRALELFESSGKKKIPVGEYKKKPIAVQKGRFGYFLVYGTHKIVLPKGVKPEEVTEAMAIERIEAKLGKEAQEKAAKKPAKSKAKASKTKAKAKSR